MHNIEINIIQFCIYISVGLGLRCLPLMSVEFDDRFQWHFTIDSFLRRSIIQSLQFLQSIFLLSPKFSRENSLLSRDDPFRLTLDDSPLFPNFTLLDELMPTNGNEWK